MSDHSRYWELAALAGGGHLSDEELRDLQRHAETCAECKNAVAEFREVVHLGLPLTQSRLRRRISMIMTRPDPDSRERFIRKASLEGIPFSSDVKRTASPRRPALSFVAAGVGVLAAIIIAVIYGSHYLDRTPHQLDPRDSTEARQQFDHLTQQNSVLEATVSRLEHTLADQQHELRVCVLKWQHSPWRQMAPATTTRRDVQKQCNQPPTAPSHLKMPRHNE
jgi:anti-sigma factor RsiW